MRIKIIKSSSSNMWYTKRIGQEYEVIGYSDKRKSSYKVIEDDEFGIMHIYVTDCDVIDDSPYKINWKREIIDYLDLKRIQLKDLRRKWLPKR